MEGGRLFVLLAGLSRVSPRVCFARGSIYLDFPTECWLFPCEMVRSPQLLGTHGNLDRSGPGGLTFVFLDSIFSHIIVHSVLLLILFEN